METFLIIAVIVVGALFLLPHLADEKTKLFRRIWSTERAGLRDEHTRNAREQALAVLVARYGIKAKDDKEALRHSVAQLLGDALAFDMKNPRNFGTEVTPILAREIRSRFPNVAD